MSLVLDSDAQAEYNQILVLILQARRPHALNRHNGGAEYMHSFCRGPLT